MMDAIATRTYQVRGMSDLVLRIGRPEKDSDGESFLCPYEIIGPLSRRISRFGGVDEMQALLNAIFAASLDLELSDEAVRGLLSLNGQAGYLGLPKPEANMSDPQVPQAHGRKRR